MTIKEQDEWIVKGVQWAARASDEIRDAGGCSAAVLRYISDEGIATMVRNGLSIKHTRIV